MHTQTYQLLKAVMRIVTTVALLLFAGVVLGKPLGLTTPAFAAPRCFYSNFYEVQNSNDETLTETACPSDVTGIDVNSDKCYAFTSDRSSPAREIDCAAPVRFNGDPGFVPQAAKVPAALTGSATPSTVNQLVSRVITFLGWIVGVVSVIGVLIGAALYVFSAGDPNRTRVAKDAIVYSIVGLIVAILAYSIVTFVIGKAN